MVALAPSWGVSLSASAAQYNPNINWLNKNFGRTFRFLTSVPAFPREERRERDEPEIESLFQRGIDSDRWAHETVPGCNG